MSASDSICNEYSAAESLVELASAKPEAIETTPVKVKLRRKILCDSKKDTKPILSGPLTCPHCHKNYAPTLNERKKLRRSDFISQVLSTDANCFMYTGVPSAELLRDLYAWVLPNAQKLKLWYCTRAGSQHGRKRKVVSLSEEMVLTLIRIRRAYDTRHIAHLFGVSQSHVSRIFIAWCKFLAMCFRPLLKWPSSLLVISAVSKDTGYYWCDGIPHREAIQATCTEINLV